MIYLDNSATTKPDPAVLKSFQQVSERFFANPSSIHQLGGEAEQLLLKAKQQCAQLLHVKPEEIIFTSGGTEGNNLAIKGIALEHSRRGKHIITSAIEHSSVYETCKALETLGFRVTYLPVNEQGIISIHDLKQAITDDTILISIMHVNNELGSIQPIKQIGQIAQEHPKLYVHVDHVQGLGKVPLNFKEYGIDLCTMSGHKIHGLKGTGILYVHERTKLFPLFHGGGQEGSYRSGTENLAGAVSLAKAIRLAKEKEQTKVPQMYVLHDRLRSELEKIEHIQVNTPVDAAPHIINFSVPGLKPEVIIHMLGEKDIYISTKSACSSKQMNDNRILSACGHDERRCQSALRISLTYDTTKEQLQTFVHVLRDAINRLKEVME